MANETKSEHASEFPTPEQGDSMLILRANGEHIVVTPKDPDDQEFCSPELLKMGVIMWVLARPDIYEPLLERFVAECKERAAAAKAGG